MSVLLKNSWINKVISMKKKKLFKSFFECFDVLQLKMEYLNKTKWFISKLDLFYSSQILRYNQDNRYKTFTGGAFSAIILAVIILSFSSMILGTFERSTIESKLEITKKEDPILLNLKTGAEGMFMFGLSIQSLDRKYTAYLSNNSKVFDLAMRVVVSLDGVVNSQTRVPLEQCTKQHWNMMPLLLKNESFEEFHVENWLCPQIASTLPLKGYSTAKESIRIKIQINQCNNQTSNNSCAGVEEIDEIFNTYENFYLTYYYINPVINPHETNYISYSIQADDYIIFSRSIGCQSTIYISDYQITTDQSILPMADNKMEEGYIILQKSQKIFYSINKKTPLSRLYFSKSHESLSYSRQVLKISAVLSYIGGLIGAVTAILFLFKIYTSYALQINTGIKLFYKNEQKDDHNQSIKSFNILNFIKLICYWILQRISCDVEQWQDCKKYDSYQSEMVKQLDIKLILRRLIKLEMCITYLFNQDQIEGIKNEINISCERASQLREKLIKYPASTTIEEAKKEEMRIFPMNKIVNRSQVMGCKKFKTQLIEMRQAFRNRQLDDDEQHKDQSVSQQNSRQLQKNYTIKDEVISVKENDSNLHFYRSQSHCHEVNSKDRIELLLREKVNIMSLMKLRYKSVRNIVDEKIWSNLDENIREAIEELPKEIYQSSDISKL